MLKATVAAALILGAAAPAAAQEKWNWHKVIPAGKTIEIKGIFGDITASPASGREVEVVATKRGRRLDASSVRIEAVEHADGATICAIYDDGDDCDDRTGRSNHHDNDTEVNFEVRVPRGVKLTARTVIGDVNATGMTADIDANSVTGNVNVSTSGLVEANTVSGSIHARIGRTDFDRLDFRTVSGDIVLEAPGDLNTNISFTTVSGDVDADWEIQMRGSNLNGRRVRGTIGKGGRELSFSTVSGDVELRKIN
jgi:hypothetical protein